MDLPTLRGLARPAGTPLAGEDLARVAALLDSDYSRPGRDPTAGSNPIATQSLRATASPPPPWAC